LRSVAARVADAAAAAKACMASVSNSSTDPSAAVTCTAPDVITTSQTTVVGGAVAAAIAAVSSASPAAVAAPTALRVHEAEASQPAVEAVWTKSAASGRWQLKLQHSSRQRSSGLQLVPRPTPATQHQLPDLQHALDAAAACTTAGSHHQAGPTSGRDNSNSNSSAGTLLAQMKAAKDAEMEAARGKLLELMCRAVHSEVRCCATTCKTGCHATTWPPLCSVFRCSAVLGMTKPANAQLWLTLWCSCYCRGP
jgi:hypothetical protein